MHLQNAGDSFSEKMLRDGCAMRFKSAEESFSDTDEEGLHGNPLYISRDNSDVSDGRDNDEDDGEGDNGDIYTEILKLWRTNRGPELPGKIS